MRDKEINGGWDLKFLVGYYVGRVMFYYEDMYLLWMEMSVI